MKKVELKALEKTLAMLPASLKKHLSNQLLMQRSSQADTLIETAQMSLLCPHCNSEYSIK